MCSEISAQNWGTRVISVLSACCFTRGSCSTSNASTPAADDCGRGTIEKEYWMNEIARASCRLTQSSPTTRHLESHMIYDDISIGQFILAPPQIVYPFRPHSRCLRRTCLSLLVARARPRAPSQELVLTLSSLTHLPLNGLPSAKQLSITLQVHCHPTGPKVRINMNSPVGTTALWRRIWFVLFECCALGAEPLVSFFVCVPGSKSLWAPCKSLLTRISCRCHRLGT
jgi:hypothetical protein